MKLTVISHIFNEEYLLPFWLDHHSRIFDNGIIIDYCSTDNSVQIIKQKCPHWTIVNTRNLSDGKPVFQSDLIDSEIHDIEKNIEGFKIVLNTTEFLFISQNFDISNYQNQNYCLAINSNSPYLLENYNPENINELIGSLLNNNLRYGNNDRPGSGYRFLHNYSHGHYHPGRHLTNLPFNIIDDLQIVWLGYFPWNENLEKRKMQIANNVSQSDIAIGAGSQHLMSLECMKHHLSYFYNRSSPLTEININLYNILNYYIAKYGCHD